MYVKMNNLSRIRLMMSLFQSKARFIVVLGPVNTIDTAAWPLLGRNPKGWGHFPAIRLMYRKYTAFAAPCLAAKWYEKC